MTADAELTSMDSSGKVADHPPMPAMSSIDHGNLGRWVEAVVTSSEQRLHETVEALRTAVHAIERKVDVLAARESDSAEERQALAARLDSTVAQLNQIVGRLSVTGPADAAARTEQGNKQEAGNLALASLINERTLPLFALLIIVVILGVIIYARDFGDEAIDRKLDRIPGVQMERPTQ